MLPQNDTIGGVVPQWCHSVGHSKLVYIRLMFVDTINGYVNNTFCLSHIKPPRTLPTHTGTAR